MFPIKTSIGNTLIPDNHIFLINLIFDLRINMINKMLHVLQVNCAINCRGAEIMFMEMVFGTRD